MFCRPQGGAITDVNVKKKRHFVRILNRKSSYNHLHLHHSIQLLLKVFNYVTLTCTEQGNVKCTKLEIAINFKSLLNLSA